jgi:ABC-type multidrug transport system permease subunit
MASQNNHYSSEALRAVCRLNSEELAGVKAALGFSFQRFFPTFAQYPVHFHGYFIFMSIHNIYIYSLISSLAKILITQTSVRVIMNMLGNVRTA